MADIGVWTVGLEAGTDVAVGVWMGGGACVIGAMALEMGGVLEDMGLSACTMSWRTWAAGTGAFGTWLTGPVVPKR